MIRKQRQFNRNRIVNNILWFGASLALAIFIWVIAVTEDVQERRFLGVNVQFETDPGLVIVNHPTRSVRVNVRAQQEVVGLLTTEDIIVEADLRGLEPGTHFVTLASDVTRDGVIADTQPRQVEVVLEQVLSQQVQVTTPIITRPPISYVVSAPVALESQVQVTGPSSQVQRVVAARATLDLEDARDNVTQSVRLQPVDADGDVVDTVTVEPETVIVEVGIATSNNIKEIDVSPDINTETLKEGYSIGNIDYSPQDIQVIGSRDDLASLPESLLTEEIDLTDRTDDFEISVPVNFPAGLALPILGDEQEVSVFVEIIAPTATRRFDNMAVSIVGAPEGIEVELTPQQVSLVVTATAALLDDLTSDDIRVSIDVSNLDSGVYDLEPNVNLEAEDYDITVLPATVTVTIPVLTETTEIPSP